MGDSLQSEPSVLPDRGSLFYHFTTGEIVYGTDGRFGAVANAAGWPNGLDTAIVEPDANVDGWQEVPGVGRVVGKMSNLYLTTSGNGIAMQSPRSGRSYGVLYGGWELWGNDRRRVACGNYQRQVHDSGAPIFVHQGDRVYAAGVHVGVVNNLGVSKSCFVTIDDLLAHWNAWLPVFNSATGAMDLLGPYSETREEV